VVGLGPDTAQLKEGDTVLYSKFGIGCTDIELAGQDYVILREEDCIGVMPRSNADADDVPELVPMFDRVLIKVAQRTAACSSSL
jgi:chaperonin GroES